MSQKSVVVLHCHTFFIYVSSSNFERSYGTLLIYDFETVTSVKYICWILDRIRTHSVCIIIFPVLFEREKMKNHQVFLAFEWNESIWDNLLCSPETHWIRPYTLMMPWYEHFSIHLITLGCPCFCSAQLYVVIEWLVKKLCLAFKLLSSSLEKNRKQCIEQGIAYQGSRNQTCMLLISERSFRVPQQLESRVRIL